MVSIVPRLFRAELLALMICGLFSDSWHSNFACAAPQAFDAANVVPHSINQLKSPNDQVRTRAEQRLLNAGWTAFDQLAKASTASDQKFATAASALLKQLIASGPKSLQPDTLPTLLELCVYGRDTTITEWAYYQALKHRIKDSPGTAALLEKIAKSGDVKCACLAKGLLAKERQQLKSFCSLLSQKKEIPGKLHEIQRNIDKFSQFPDPGSKFSVDSLVESYVQWTTRAKEIDADISLWKSTLQKAAMSP
jgi:hypothetical protein